MQFILSLEGARRGIWTVAPRRDEEDFTDSDQRILKTLARQAEIALSNVILVETLRHQLAEIRASQESLLRPSTNCSAPANKSRLAWPATCTMGRFSRWWG